MKLLYNKETGLLQPWPAGTADHVEALDPIYEEVEVIQNEKPEFDPATHYLEPTQTISLEDRTVTRGWTVVEAPVTPAPPAERYQVKEYLIRRGISLASIPAMIAAVTPEGVELDVALMRWDQVTSLPKNHPLVTAVAAQLSLNLDEVWDSIIAIK